MLTPALFIVSFIRRHACERDQSHSIVLSSLFKACTDANSLIKVLGTGIGRKCGVALRFFRDWIIISPAAISIRSAVRFNASLMRHPVKYSSWQRVLTLAGWCFDVSKKALRSSRVRYRRLPCEFYSEYVLFINHSCRSHLCCTEIYIKNRALAL